MNWSEARDKTLAEWARIRDHLEEIEPLELLTEINAMNTLCDKAEEQAHGRGRCDYCVGYHQFGGCGDITAEMNRSLLDKDWPALRRQVQLFMERLEKLEI